ASAVLISGSSPPSNATSTTGPITWMMRPCAPALTCPLLVVVMVVPSSFEGLRTAHDLHQLLGDGRLAGAVVLQGVGRDHLFGVVAGVLYRGHARVEL